MQRVSHILNRIIRQYGLEGKFDEHRLAEQWEEVVGKIISTHTHPAGIHYRKLYVVVDSPSWLQEISFYKKDIIDKVNTFLGRNLIEDIYFKTGQK